MHASSLGWTCLADRDAVQQREEKEEAGEFKKTKKDSMTIVLRQQSAYTANRKKKRDLLLSCLGSWLGPCLAPSQTAANP